jgi:colanic acid biosynthesis glycosyl transferase WcaI
VHVLVITQFYPPEIGPTQSRLESTVGDLSEAGHRVTVITALPSYPTGEVPVEYRDMTWSRDRRGLVTVIRVWSHVAPNQGVVRRTFSHVSFAGTALAAGLQVDRPDVILTDMHPIFAAFAAQILATVRRAPIVLNVNDLIPEQAIAYGHLANPLAVAVSRGLARYVLKRADARVAFTRGIGGWIKERGFTSPNDAVIYYGADIDPVADQAIARADHLVGAALDGKFVVTYAGNHGSAYALETVLLAASQLRAHDDIHFLFVGEGSKKEELMRRATDLALENVTFMAAVRHELMPSIYAVSSAVVVPLMDSEFTERLALSSKVFEALAAGRPVIAAARGETAEIVSRANGGLVVEPEDPEALAKAVLQVKSTEPERLAEWGRRGHEFVARNYSRRIRSRRLIRVIERLVAPHRRTPPPASVATIAQTRRSVLLITHSFAPALGSGVQRVLGFVTNLPALGWDSIVLTASHPPAAHQDNALLDRVPRATRIERTPWIDLTSHARVAANVTAVTAGSGRMGRTRAWLRRWLQRWVLVPDDAIGWVPFAIARGRRLLNTSGADVMLSTSPPASNHLVGLVLHRFTRTPWIADFRDLWTTSPYDAALNSYRLRWRSALEQWFERKVLLAAQFVTTVTPGFLDALTAASGRRDIVLLPNGFDPEALNGLYREPPDRFTLTYTGRFYSEHRTIRGLLDVLANLADEGVITPANFQLRVVGASVGQVANELSRAALPAGLVIVRAQVRHREALQEQLNATMLLVIVGASPGERDAVPAKLYEYIGARRPVFALVPPDSAVADIIRASMAGIVVDPADVAAVRNALRDAVREYSTRGDLPVPNNAYERKRLSRDKGAAILARLLNQAVTGSGVKFSVAAEAHESTAHGAGLSAE